MREAADGRAGQGPFTCRAFALIPRLRTLNSSAATRPSCCRSIGFARHASRWYGLVVLIGLTWAFFQHLFSGIRHLVMDTGMGFELKGNKAGAIATIVLSVIATAVLWAYWLGALA